MDDVRAWRRSQGRCAQELEGAREAGGRLCKTRVREVHTRLARWDARQRMNVI